MRAIGNIGEDYAVKILKKNKYKIIERNFTVRGGEIDIIAKDGEYLVFTEVKLRRSADFGRPSEYVGLKKQENLRTAAMLYMKKTEYDGLCRFDVVEIIGEINEKGKLMVSEANVIKNAF
ncbi:MAG: YraN family protein [Clostridia bacterium]|nr:YraN family protein [Clostridia bacterium]